MIRLTIFSQFADKIIIGYSNRTIQWEPKPVLSFNPFDDEITDFGSQLVQYFINVENKNEIMRQFPVESQSHAIEKFSRSSLLLPVLEHRPCPMDVIYLSDTDEYPSPATLQSISNGMAIQNPGRVKCQMTYYGIRWLHGSHWCSPYFIYFNDIKDQKLANIREFTTDGQFYGLHISYGFPKIADYIHKLNTFSHTEYRKPPYVLPEYIFARIACGHDLFGRGNLIRDLGSTLNNYIPTLYDQRFAFLTDTFPDTAATMTLNWTLIKDHFNFCPQLREEYSRRVTVARSNLKKHLITMNDTLNK